MHFTSINKLLNLSSYLSRNNYRWQPIQFDEQYFCYVLAYSQAKQNLSKISIPNKTIKKNLPFKLNKINTFKIFINTNTFQSKGLFGVHGSFTRVGFANTTGNGGFININKFKQYYTKFFNLAYYILYYKLRFLMFSTPAFKEETCSINWLNTSYYTFIWRYNFYSIFYQPLKMHEFLPTVFRNIYLNGINIGWVSDSIYHRRTLYYLHRASFYTVGTTGLNQSKYTLNAALPTMGDTVSGQLFFIRLTLLLLYSLEHMRFNNYIK